MATLPFDVSALNTVLGAYFRENSETIIEDMIYTPDDNPEFNVWNITEKLIVKDEQSWGTADFDPEVQDANLAFDAQGNIITMDGRIIKMRYMRSDFKIEVRKLYNTWLGHIAQEGYHDAMSSGDLTVAMVAFGDWIINGLTKKHFEKLMLQTAFLGAYSANFDATPANSYNKAADGFRTIMDAARTAGTIPAGNVVALAGAVTSSNAYDHFEALGEALAEKFYYKPMYLVCSVNNARDYNKAFKTAHPGANVNIHDSYKRTVLQNSPMITILPTPELGASDTCFITPDKNLLFATEFGDRPPQLFTSVSDDPMVINATLLHGCAFGVKREDWITINDQ